jgi:glycosyltransferase involved in cell wall biosynthesis
VKVLWIGTKEPAPPVDGGRLLTLQTLAALAAAGAEVTLVAPSAHPSAPAAGGAGAGPPLAALCRPELVAARPRGRLPALLASLAGGTPYSIGRHRVEALRRRVAALLERQRFDVVHAEQLQAFPQASPARERSIPVVLRAQNVESDLWAAAAGRSPARPWLVREARRLAAWEGRAVGAAAAVLALTAPDAARLRELAGGREVEVVPVPFPARLPPGEETLPGSPPLVILGRRDWFPNRDAAAWFVAEVWPRVRQRVPAARLHLFDPPPALAAAAGVELHPPPADSRRAFAPGSVMVVPLRIASGVRMKILEAWARGVAVVATPAAAAGLEARDEGELLLADDAEGFAAAVARLAAEPALGAALTAAGRRLLAARHDGAGVAARLLAAYRRAAGGGGGVC